MEAAHVHLAPERRSLDGHQLLPATREHASSRVQSDCLTIALINQPYSKQGSTPQQGVRRGISSVQPQDC